MPICVHPNITPTQWTMPMGVHPNISPTGHWVRDCWELNAQKQSDGKFISLALITASQHELWEYPIAPWNANPQVSQVPVSVLHIPMILEFGEGMESSEAHFPMRLLWDWIRKKVDSAPTMKNTSPFQNSNVSWEDFVTESGILTVSSSIRVSNLAVTKKKWVTQDTLITSMKNCSTDQPGEHCCCPCAWHIQISIGTENMEEKRKWRSSTELYQT